LYLLQITYKVKLQKSPKYLTLYRVQFFGSVNTILKFKVNKVGLLCYCAIYDF